jgi:lipopolysaccharide export system protein LptA
MRLTLGNLLSTIAAVALAAGIAQAQPQPQAQPQQNTNALQGFSQNRNEPVQINARTLEVRDKKKMATYTGSVVLVQGDTTLRCNVLVVFYDGGEAGAPTVKSSTPGPTGTEQIRRIEATGSVVVTQKGQTATGEKAIYDIADDTVRLFPARGGTVVVTQGPNVVRGQRLIVHLDTGVSHFESDGSGGVYSLIVPGNKGENPAAAPPSAHPGPTPHAAPRTSPKVRATTPSSNPSGLY